MNIGNSIKDIRKKLGISQSEMSKACGISATSLSQIENGIKAPSEKTLEKLSNFLRVPLPVIYMMSFSEEDVPVSKRKVFSHLYPTIKALVFEIAEKDVAKKLNE